VLGQPSASVRSVVTATLCSANPEGAPKRTCSDKGEPRGRLSCRSTTIRTTGSCFSGFPLGSPIGLDAGPDADWRLSWPWAF
jgi:hypothetical protein